MLHRHQGVSTQRKSHPGSACAQGSPRGGGLRPFDTGPCDAVRKTAIPQKQQRGTPHRWLRDPQTADTLHAIDERCLDFKELPARSLVLSLSQPGSAC